MLTVLCKREAKLVIQLAAVFIVYCSKLLRIQRFTMAVEWIQILFPVSRRARTASTWY